jgi:hypothetical protein
MQEIPANWFIANTFTNANMHGSFKIQVPSYVVFFWKCGMVTHDDLVNKWVVAFGSALNNDWNPSGFKPEFKKPTIKTSLRGLGQNSLKPSKTTLVAFDLS